MKLSFTPGHGSKLRGNTGLYWRIKADDVSAGVVFINMINAAPFGPHASVQVFLNKAHQGRGIGAKAYRYACQHSGCTAVYAHMRRSNLASRRAAEKAGFIVDPTPQRQLTLVWHA